MDVRFHLFKDKLPLYNRALDAYALRQETTARNIANAQTPNYRPERVKFEELFDTMISEAKGVQTDGRHIPIGPQPPGSVIGEAGDAEIPRAEVLFSGESHVNIDKEMAQLAENQIRFRLASRMTAGLFQKLQSAIRGTAQ